MARRKSAMACQRAPPKTQSVCRPATNEAYRAGTEAKSVGRFQRRPPRFSARPQLTTWRNGGELGLGLSTVLATHPAGRRLRVVRGDLSGRLAVEFLQPVLDHGKRRRRNGTRGGHDEPLPIRRNIELKIPASRSEEHTSELQSPMYL